MRNLQSVAKALSNPVRMQIFEYLLERRVANKSDLLAETGLERASLNHHLRSLAEAGLVVSVDVTIDKVRNSLCFLSASVSLESRSELSSQGVRALLGSEVESDVDHTEIEERAQRAIGKGELARDDAKAILRTLFEHRGRGTKNTCTSCGRIKRMSDLALCDNCLRPACQSCRQKVDKTEGGAETICDRCMRELFGS
ncbi:MAG: helix-turn-helix transcriptional regulator [Candidatus Thorarchaeota archaeon]|nr:MAG: helix-turn-helix transcriptional regulator [Candidatus Thorarchaeota archaeon]